MVRRSNGLLDWKAPPNPPAACPSQPADRAEPLADRAEPLADRARTLACGRFRLPLRGLGGRPLVMGILNVTPDSFSDGGQFVDPAAACRQAWRMVEEGADLLDLGGESTRPGAAPVPAEEELRRVLPVIETL